MYRRVFAHRGLGGLCFLLSLGEPRVAGHSMATWKHGAWIELWLLRLVWESFLSKLLLCCSGALVEKYREGKTVDVRTVPGAYKRLQVF